LLRLFQSDMGGQISWLIPAALILLVAVLALTWRAGRTDRTRAAVALWGGYLLVTGVVFSFAQGIIHPYYNVALAPAVGALVGIGTVTLWQHRRRWLGRGILALSLAVTSVWSFVLMGRSPDWFPWLRPLVLAVGLAAAVVMAVAPRLRSALAAIVAVAGLSAALAGPAAYALDTVATPHDGAIPSAGPAVVASAAGAPGGLGAGSAFGGGLGGVPGGGRSFGFHRSGSLAAPGGGRGVPGGFPGAAGGGLGPTGGPGGHGFGAGTGGGVGGGSGFLNASTPGKALVALLEKNAGSYKWAAATVNSNAAAGYQLATDDPVMAIGGFNGTDPAPTLAQFETYVRDGDVHYFISGGLGGGGFGGSGSGGTTTASQITSWVESHFTAQTVDGVTVYDLASAARSS
jgi:4-amino-4-deoxy-L-arabinose transferase-like glycosyltransferase